MRTAATLAIAFFAIASTPAQAETIPGEYLVKLKSAPRLDINGMAGDLDGAELRLAVPERNVVLVKPGPARIPNGDVLDRLRARPDVVSIQPNFRYRAMLYIDHSALSKPVFAPETALLDSLFTVTPPRAPEAIATAMQQVYKPEVRLEIDDTYGSDPLMREDKDIELTNAKEAWKVERGSHSVVVGVIDAGIDYNHEDLAANMWHDPYYPQVVGWDFVDNDAKPYDLTHGINPITGAGNAGHGTHCAGNIGAVGRNGVGTSGIAQRVSIMALRALNQDGAGDTATTVQAIDWAVDHGAQIISASWGSDGATEQDYLMRDAIERAETRGVLFIAAAGNTPPATQGDANNDTNEARRTYPASFGLPNIISVAASDRKGRMANFTHFGPRTVDIAAPGEKSFSTVPMARNPDEFEGMRPYEDTISLSSGARIPWNGTSMATPQVAGAAALLLAHYPGWSYMRVKRRLLRTARPEPTFAGKIISGGVLDAGKALRSNGD